MPCCNLPTAFASQIPTRCASSDSNTECSRKAARMGAGTSHLQSRALPKWSRDAVKELARITKQIEANRKKYAIKYPRTQKGQDLTSRIERLEAAVFGEKRRTRARRDAKRRIG